MEFTKFKQEMWKMSEFLFERDREIPSFARERYNICRGCEKFWGGICKECGCVMAVKTKFKKSSCPIGKWDSISKDPESSDLMEGEENA